MEKAESNGTAKCLVCSMLLSAKKNGEMECIKVPKETEKCYGGHWIPKEMNSSKDLVKESGHLVRHTPVGAAGEGSQHSI